VKGLQEEGYNKGYNKVLQLQQIGVHQSLVRMNQKNG
jgi:hypothetical protein